MHPVIVCVEGIIGSGKSTLLDSIPSTEEIRVIQEPVKKFQNMGRYNPLEVMYSNRKEAITVQAYIQDVLRKYWTKHLASTQPGQILLSERSLYSTEIFTDHLRKTGALTQFQFDFLSYQLQETLDSLDLPVFGADKLFFLDVPVKTCFERMIGRGRVEEKHHCDLEYLDGLGKTMKDFLEAFRRVKGEDKVMVTKTTDLDVLKQELLTFVHT